MAIRRWQTREGRLAVRKLRRSTRKRLGLDRLSPGKRLAALKITALKAVTPCADCGGIFPAVCMDFDHMRDKTGEISQLVKAGGWPRIQAEIDKCEIVCANCHRIRTQKRVFSGK